MHAAMLHAFLVALREWSSLPRIGRAKASPSNGRHIQREGVGGWDKDLDGQRHAMPLAMHVEKILLDRFLEVCVSHTRLDC